MYDYLIYTHTYTYTFRLTLTLPIPSLINTPPLTHNSSHSPISLPTLSGGPNEEDLTKPPADVEDESSLLGKSWCYEVSIVRASDLPVYTEMSYVSYTFFGETFVTEGE